MLLREGSINPCVLLRGVSIELPSHAVQAIQDVKGLALLGSLEKGVLNKMSDPRFTIRMLFIARSRVDD